ncbi:DUF742 domain-containing protein [Streptomyces tubbatahanensis]|uniref:DUF742 domain-containing protein n=1 Tax=Streptomyces tubbatahanensis TaxID=2923272 RepID=A0ABY3Y3L3_9ACTN|nr:DUF742 domain-containing protein [Streptomyces tubbatahanensis]UNT01333.1 DUF742 domain-containing protein [Streptomyces tubbatahanensis]
MPPQDDGRTPSSCGGAPPQFDEAAGRLGRPYTASGGRTRPTTAYQLTTLVRATGARPLRYFGPEHRRLLQLCAGGPLSVAELAAQLRLPVVVTKVVLCDLLDSGAVAVRAPARVGAGQEPVEGEVLEALLEGLRRRLSTRS